MDRSSKPGPPQEGGTLAAEHSRHFDTFETKFFEQGDAAHPHGQVERFEDLEESTPPRTRAPSRPFLLGVAVGAACAAVLGCMALWRGGHVSPKPEVARVPPAAVVPAARPQNDPAPPARAEPVLPKVPGLPAAELAPAPVSPAVAQPGEAADVVAPEPASVRADCQQAIRGGRARQIIHACAAAFAVDPTAADLAVAVAKAELDRGHGVQALAWGKKAVGADPNVADAYVFIGGAEQSAGRDQAAKEAYRRYLELAPKGRYAADLRAIVGRL